jgi:hypothetical protein
MPIYLFGEKEERTFLLHEQRNNGIPLQDICSPFQKILSNWRKMSTGKRRIK